MLRFGWLCALCLLACSDPAFDPGDGGGLRPDRGVVTPGFDAAPEPGTTPNCRPAPEACDAVDNDCDGRVDEVACSCAGSTACFAGPFAARNVGTCTDGVRHCDATGESFGPCEGSVGPTAETCNGQDDDCDGVVDERCDGGAGGGAGGAGAAGGAGGVGGGAGLPGEPNQESFVVGAQRLNHPVDFVMAVDNSSSMDDTVAQVEANLGQLAARLVQAGIDYHLVLVSQRGTRANDPDVCIPPPMAGPNCADTDRFIHLDEEVDSNEPLEDILKCWDTCGRGIASFLRPGSLLQLVVVTDDNSDMSWRRFHARMGDLDRRDFVLHAVVGLAAGGCVAAVGEEYIRAAEETGGARLNICQNDWGQVIDVLLDATTIQLQRAFRLAGDPDPDTLRVFVVQPNGVEEEQLNNWHYDPATRAILFDEGTGPAAGQTVVVRYINR